jgi:hypothetical protein
MRYSDGGGLSERGRVRREQVRRKTAGWFAEDYHWCQLLTTGTGAFLASATVITDGEAVATGDTDVIPRA